MTGGQMMVVIIVAMAMLAGIFKSRYRYAHRQQRDLTNGQSRQVSTETERLRDEVKTLKDRLAVIERITVEKENSLEREIERLRDS